MIAIITLITISLITISLIGLYATVKAVREAKEIDDDNMEL